MASLNENFPNRDGQHEEITQLRIRVAVLETELDTKTKEATETERNLVVFAKVLATHYFENSQPPTSNGNHNEYLQDAHARGYGASRNDLVEKLENEIEDLRLDNRSLRERLRNSQQASTLPPQTPESPRPHEEQAENGPVSVETSATYTHEACCGNTPSALFTPESMVLPANYSAGVANVGMNLLDDVLGPEDADLPDSPSPLPNTSALASRPSGQEVTTHISLSTASQVPDYKLDEGVLQQFQNIPTPLALKTGFEISRSYRGGNYEAQEGNISSEDESSRQMFPQAGLAQSRWAHANADASNATPCKSGEERAQEMMDRNRAIHPQDFRGPDIFKYGIEYIPTKEDSNYFRMVHIGNLPKRINLRDVLTRVRGGQIVSATLVDTTLITGSFTAIIQFVHEVSAQNYVRFTSRKPITFGDDDEKITAEVTLIHTPTYPLSNGKKNLLFNYGQTRCFCIANISSHISVVSLQTDISRRNKVRAESLLETYFDEERVLHMEFSSLSAAGVASGILATYSAYRGLTVEFEKDPCAGPVEELLLEVPMRRPFCPKGGFIGYGEVPRSRRDHRVVKSDTDLKGEKIAPTPVMGVQNLDEIALDDTDSTT